MTDLASAAAEGNPYDACCSSGIFEAYESWATTVPGPNDPSPTILPIAASSAPERNLPEVSKGSPCAPTMHRRHGRGEVT